MPLRGVAPKEVSKRLKALFYGEPGAGKTTTAIQFPKPYLVDTEKGAENDEYVKLLNKAGGAYFHTTDIDDLMQEVTTLLTEKHDYRTLVIDPLTPIYNDLLDRASRQLATPDDPTGTAFSRHKGLADRKIKHLLVLLTRLDMNVIITSHSKGKWEKVGGELINTGNTFDCYSKLNYLFDLVFEVTKRGKEQRVAIVQKTRVAGFPEGDIFPFTYLEIAKRYGQAILEKQSEATALATPEQVSKIKRMVEAQKIEDEKVEKLLDKGGATAFEELSQEHAQKFIDWLTLRAHGEVIDETPKKGNGKTKDKKEEATDGVPAQA